MPGLRQWLPRFDAQPSRDSSRDPELPALSLAAFSDDLVVPRLGRTGVRVVVTSDGRRYACDFADSDPVPRLAPWLTVSSEECRIATAIALQHMLPELGSAASLVDRLDVRTDASTVVGAGSSSDPAATAMLMARIFDAVCGAFGRAWPSRSRAGSCTIGAIVEFGDRPEAFEVLPGGEGATIDRPGADVWAGPILAPRLFERNNPEGLELALWPADGSGGGGKRAGGAGVVRRYRATRSVVVRVVIDRIENPPHGLDRAGPPVGGAVRSRDAAGDIVPIVPWTRHRLAPGDTLEVRTAGGGGHGFPGYGEIEWDPAEWFGASSST